MRTSRMNPVTVAITHFVLGAITAFAFYAGPTQAEDKLGLRDQRYCEVVLGYGGLVIPSQLDVYNTIGLNDCPDPLWRQLDADQIKEETQAKVVKLNGPRHWLIDGFRNTQLQDPTVVTFGGIEMRKGGILKISLSDAVNQNKPYRLHSVRRKSTAIFLAGQKEFQLVDAKGNVFFMQSYSQQKTEQSLSTLPELGTRLKLPKGWSFRVVTLQADYFLKAENDLATVTRDDFENTYQLAPGAKPDHFRD